MSCITPIEENPHILQVLLNPDRGYISHTDIPFVRILPSDTPRIPYYSRKDEKKTVIHWGQRKLLLSEIEFLTLYAKPGDQVIYAGSAPGTHIFYLSALFPYVKFILVDPAPFNIRESKRIEIHQTLFTDELAKEIKGDLFICDIRSADWEIMSEQEVEERVEKDMNAQMKWHEIINPRASILKFRLPWKEGSTEYLSGDIYLPVWGPTTTTESRLIVTQNEKKIYDNKKYEEQMFYFNTVMRVARYKHNIIGEGLDHCYDCTAEIHIIKEYLKKNKYKCIKTTIPVLSQQISRMLSKERTLSSPNVDPEEIKGKIKKRQYIKGKPAYL
ncbi:MAG: hypothetical protein QW303_05265 [Nitrososphaerota archaeon]